MPLFTVIGRDAPNTLEQRLAARSAHVARLKKLDNANCLVLAGPFPTDHSKEPKGFTGSLLVVDFPDRAALDAWLEEEPYLLSGVYESVEILPFRKVLPESILAWGVGAEI